MRVGPLHAIKKEPFPILDMKSTGHLKTGVDQFMFLFSSVGEKKREKKVNKNVLRQPRISF